MIVIAESTLVLHGRSEATKQGAVTCTLLVR